MSEPWDQIELDQSTAAYQTAEDPRPKMDEPPPVRLVSVDDCYLWSPAGLERQLDEFYVGLLGFVREDFGGEIGQRGSAGDRPSPQPSPGVSGEGEGKYAHELVYRAENFRVRIEILERPIGRDDFRALGVVVGSLSDLANRLNEAEIEYERQRGLMPGQDSLLLCDPAGNAVIVGESRVTI